MNFLLTILLLLVTLTGFPPKTASDAEVGQIVQTSLRKGDAGQLATYFDKTIELVIDAEKIEFISVEATHAELILRSFFRKYPPHGFAFVYRGASNRLRYSTGTYATEGHPFSVYVLMRQNANHQYVINALHFRKE